MHKKMWKRFVIGVVALLGVAGTSFSQQAGKPKLIREPVQEIEEEQKNAEKKGPEKPDPVKAQKNLEVGKYYFRQKNWAAAEDRFRMSTEQNPKMTESWELLSRSCAKQKKFRQAADVLSQYVQKFPKSEEAVRFAKERVRLDKKAQEEEPPEAPPAGSGNP
jgi:predicted Zn-dependent protease